ncbi:hypothetical protein KUCAC02_001772 [Chaenocephalus aceratus]|uniref:Uncharacterized protein n=1 Tax=Chaenocephalus aceratus TaxID=36190 RepID=A0ACB9XT59_CHAAC|nr:hypothetical protein KUCAC02_001772 [Chaenocephalus aceratus]
MGLGPAQHFAMLANRVVLMFGSRSYGEMGELVEKRTVLYDFRQQMENNWEGGDQGAVVVGQGGHVCYCYSTA